MNSRRTPLMFGLILALGTGISLYTYLAAQAHPAPKSTVVVVAASDIPARSVVSSSMVRIETHYGVIDTDAISDPQRVIGKSALITIPAGTLISASKVGTTGALALPNRLANGLRAVSISIDKVKGVSGLVQPGDRVDVIAVPPRLANETPKATTIIRGGLVLAIGGETETVSATPSPQNANLTTVTLALTPKQVDLIALADVNTTLRLALRSPHEPIRAFPTEPLQLGVNPTPPAAPAAAPAAAPRASLPQSVSITAYRPLPPGLQRPRRQSSVLLIDGDKIIAADGTGVKP